MSTARSRTVIAMLLQAAALGVLLLAWASVSWLDSRSRPRLLVLVDRSDSVPRDSSGRALSDLDQAVRAAGGLLQWIDFAGQPAAQAATPAVELEPGATDLQAALDTALVRHAREPLAGLVVISDGHANRGDTGRALQSVREAGLPLRWIAVGRPPPRARIAQVLAPSRAWAGQAVRVQVAVQGERDRPLELVATARTQDGLTRQARALVDAAGQASLLIDALPGAALLIDLLLQEPGAAAPLDTRADAAVVQLLPRAPLLVVQGGAGASALADSLQRGGWPLERIEAARLDAIADNLERYHALVLDDVSISDAGPRWWNALDRAVRERGLGLLVLGGERSFAHGGYRGSVLESLLPVLAEPAALDQPVSLVFAVDKSGSMGQGSAGVDRFAMAQRAVIDTAQALQPRDALGLVLFDAAPRVAIALGPAAAAQSALQRDWQAAPRGGTRLAPALEAALAELEKAAASRRMLVLVTDGFVDDAPLAALQARLRQAKVEILALAIGPDADLAALQRLVSASGGQVLRVNEVAELPRVMRAGFERRRARVQQGRIAVQQREALPFAPGRLPAWPDIAAHALTRLKPQAHAALQTTQGEPVLALHQAGLGRVVAMTSGLGAWTPQWLRWSEWPTLAGGLVDWIGALADQAVALNVSDQADRLRIDGEIASTALVPDAAALSLVVETPAGRRRTAAIDALAGGRWQAELPAEGPGLYTLLLSTPQGTQRSLHLRRALVEGQAWGVNPELERWRAEGLVDGGDPATIAQSGGAIAARRPPDRSLMLLALALFLAGVLIDRIGVGRGLSPSLPRGLRRARAAAAIASLVAATGLSLGHDEAARPVAGVAGAQRRVGAIGHQLAAAHQQHARTEFHHIGRVVRDDDGALDRGQTCLQALDQIRAGQPIDIGEGLVQQQQPRVGRQRSGQRDALRLAAGQRGHVAPVHRVQAHVGQRLACALLARGAVGAADAEGRVAQRVQVREQCRVLERQRHRTELRRHQDAPGAGHRLPEQPDAAGAGGIEPGHHAHQRGLAAARRAQHRQHLATGHVEGDVVHQRPAADDTRDAPQRQDGAGRLRHAERSPSGACATTAAPAAAASTAG